MVLNKVMPLVNNMIIKNNLSDTDTIPLTLIKDLERNETLLYTVSLAIEEAYFNSDKSVKGFKDALVNSKRLAQIIN